MREAGRRPPGAPARAAAPALVLLAALGTAAAAGQPTPAGGELQVNTYTTSSQSAPEVSAGADGAFVVVWASDGSAGSDASAWSVQARRFDAHGVPAGAELQVNSGTGGDQTQPDVDRDAQGGFVVVWTSDTSLSTDTDYASIQGRRFDGAGVPLGEQFQVNSSTTGKQWLPAVAVDRTSGRFLVVWHDDDDGTIQGQAFQSDGDLEGGQFRVEDDDGTFHFNPAIASSAPGEFVLAWETQNSSVDQGYGIRTRRFSALGAALGDSFQVNTYTTGSQYTPAVAGTGQGDWVVAWESSGSTGADTSGWSIHARRFGPTGALGESFEVNTYTTSEQGEADVSVDEHGHFVIVWDSAGSTGSDWSFDSVQARRYDAAGVPLGDQFQVNTATPSYQVRPRIANDGPGDLIVVWRSDASAGDDTDLQSIQAQRYDDVFREGFEAGDWSRWSNVMSGQPSS